MLRVGGKPSLPHCHTARLVARQADLILDKA